MARHRLIARRKAMGFTQTSLARALHCERSTVARWEREECDVSAEFRQPLAGYLKWSLTELDDALNGHNPNRPLGHGWWSNYVTLEQSAQSVFTYEPLVIPGLLQCESYARALLDDVDQVARRLERQAMLKRSDGSAVDLVAVVDESVLYRPIGGRDVLAEQLRHVVRMSEYPNVTVQVMPYTAPVQPTSWGAFLVLTFPWPGGLVHQEHHGDANDMGSVHTVEAHLDVFGQLRELALTPSDSVDLIRDRVRELEP